MSKFSKKVTNTTRNEGIENKEQPFVKDDRDNDLFPQLQVKDLSTITDANTTMILDSDGIVWKACSSVESLYIIAKHKTEAVEVELEGIQQFKGLGKKISVDSWLGVQNVKLETEDLPLWTPEDFEITQHHRLNYDTEEKAWEQVQIMVRTKLKNLRQQFGIQNIKPILGEGHCFRENLDLVKPYKGERSPLRPIMLKKARKWVMEDLGGEHAPEGYEGDDVTEWYGAEGYKHYKNTGIFNYIVVAEDKDAMSNPKCLINFGTHSGKDNPLKGKYKYPNAWVIHDSGVSAGELDLVAKHKKELKGSGLKWVIAQAFLIGDTADSYNALKHLPQKTDYADVKAYKDFAHLKTPKEVLQKVVDLYADFFPYGIQYTNHKGEDLDVPTLAYMDTYFAVAHMTRSKEDNLTFTKLCKAFKVDTSKVVDNNKLTPPKLTFIEEKAEKNVDITKELCNDILPDLKSYKSLKKDLLVERLDNISGKLNNVMQQFDNFYEMRQEEK